MSIETPSSSKIVDLTHSLCSESPSWDGTCGFNISNLIDYSDCTAPNLFRVQSISSRAGMGTHIDAPAHCFPQAKAVDELALDDLVTSYVVIKLDQYADENYVIMPDIVHNFERKNGAIAPTSFVIFYTGWSKYWGDPKRYRNNLKFPSIHEETAKLLIEKNISGLGTDTLSPDAKGDSFPVHRVILGGGKFLVENIANADSLPSFGEQMFILPMKIKEGTEAPVRMIAMV